MEDGPGPGHFKHPARPEERKTLLPSKWNLPLEPLDDQLRRSQLRKNIDLGR